MHGVSDYQLLSFMDTYSGHNQIRMHPDDMDKMAFITGQSNYCYKVMSFGLKNAGATYQQLINKILTKLIKKIVEAYVNELVVKSLEVGKRFADL